MLKRMTILLLLSLLLIAAKCDLPHPPPPSELCGSDLAGSMLLCNDPRLEETKQNYSRSLQKGDICTNADDFKSLQKDNIDLRTKLAKFEKTCKLIEK